MESEHYGHTCDKCPSRGLRSVVGDFAPVKTWNAIETPQMRLTDNGVTSEGFERAIRWTPIGFPERCKKCNERYARFKRAREAIHRLELIRLALSHDETWIENPHSENLRESADAPRWRYLRFVTLTWPIVETQDEKPDLEKYKNRYLSARSALSVSLDVKGGTDVMECVSTEMPNGKWKHNVHFHGIWLMPYHTSTVIAEAMKNAGIGRDQVRAIKEDSYRCKYTGEKRTVSAKSRAVAYLAKYMTKEVMGNRRRISWGELRRWKNHIPKPFRCTCIKTTHGIWKDHEECAGDE